ncbi:unnamed protein product [Didymodactylos carnosus]|uniref:Uncharacterized protein n=1 Tax=Didymodactylos carnosus TaxID=1234261 RepID=A0A815VA43_9BILA|nr:unnamed protein product [Didymodactylos carnosus]CAF1526527.1 unnamed protein product [Didymodactylos carnosus]CAF4195550.1 unnamed protein product [Didymodactylos carnosus]CAF4385597.1 unnamed protein product [Didymodactylos carnosus]
MHSDGVNIMTTKHRHCYATTATILEIPPPLRDVAKNKILLSLYFGRKQPSVESMYGRLIDDILTLKQRGLTVENEKNEIINFNFRCQTDKNDLPCRAVKWKINQFNENYACTHCKQEGNTLNSPLVYYPYSDNHVLRTQHDFVHAAKLAASRSKPGYVTIVEGIKGLTPLLKIYKNVTEHCIFDYMHAVCGGSGHIGHLLQKWLSHTSSTTATQMSDFVLETLIPHDVKVIMKSFSDLEWYKSKELKFFLLYISMPLVVKFLPAAIANHFVLFFLSIRILHFYEDVSQIDDAKEFLQQYRKELAAIYGAKFELYSVHLLQYFPNQCRQHGALYTTSYFSEESFLGYLKSLRKNTTVKIGRNIFHQYLLQTTIHKDETLTLENLFIDEQIYDSTYISKQELNKFLPLLQQQFQVNI